MSSTARPEIEAVIIAAPERRVEEEMAGFLEADQRAGFVAVALDVGVASLPVIRRGAIGLEHRVGEEQASRFHVDDEFGASMQAGNVARQHHPDAVGKDFAALIIDDAAAVAVAVEGESHIGAMFAYRRAEVMQHRHGLGVRIVMREAVVQLAMQRDHLAADRPPAPAGQKRRRCRCRRRRRPSACGSASADW